MSLKTYFNSVVDILKAQAVLAGESSENIDKGANREAICRKFLDKHIPRRFAVATGGDIFGVNQPKSGQIDIIIAHDISISFRENDRPQFPVESVTAAVSVKSNLTGDELDNALLNIASIPQPHEETVQLGILRKPFSEFLLCQPATFVFAFKGVKPDTCVERLKNFYSKTEVPFNRVPRGIIVLGEYVVYFPHYNKPDATIKSKFDPNMLTVAGAHGEGKGSALFWMMIEIAKGLSWLDGTYLDFGDYYAEAYK